MRRLLAPATAILLTLSACGGSPAHNDADVAFAQAMVPHHEQALEMAELVPGSGASAEVTALAEHVADHQEPEIALMTDWLDDWGVDDPGAMDHGDDHGSMPGMMTATDMDELAAASGPAFDELWLTMMTDHHEGAVAMAQTVLDEGESPDVEELATAIVADQQAEIADMEELLR